MQKYTYICWIHTDAIIIMTPDDKVAGINDAHGKTQEDFFIKYFTSHFICKVSKRVTQSLRERESWRPNITEIFWPQSYGRQRCVFLVLHGCLTGPWSKLFCVLAFPTTSRLLPSSTVLLALLLAYLSLSSIRRPYLPSNSHAVISSSSSSSSSSYRTSSTDIPDPLSPLLPIVHRPR